MKNNTWDCKNKANLGVLLLNFHFIEDRLIICASSSRSKLFPVD